MKEKVVSSACCECSHEESETRYECNRCAKDTERESKLARRRCVMVTRGPDSNTVVQMPFNPNKRKPRIGDIVAIDTKNGYVETVSRETPIESLSFVGKVVG